MGSSYEQAAFSIPIRVYYEDTDAGGVVYHSKYINFFERARTEWLRSLGLEQNQLATEHQVIFVVRSLNCDYIRPALFNDELFVSADIRELRKTSVVFKQQILRKAKNEETSNQDDYVVLAEGDVKVVAVDAIKFTAKRLPNFLLDKINN